MRRASAGTKVMATAAATTIIDDRSDFSRLIQLESFGLSASRPAWYGRAAYIGEGV